MNEEQPQFPQYPAPAQGMADRKQAAPLQKLISSRFKPKMRLPKKGLQSQQKVRINHKKVRYY